MTNSDIPEELLQHLFNVYELYQFDQARLYTLVMQESIRLYAIDNCLELDVDEVLTVFHRMFAVHFEEESNDA